MKKLIVLAIILLCFSLNVYEAFSKNSCREEIVLEGVNSKDLIPYIYNNHLIDKIIKVCSNTVCTNINATQLENDVNAFISKNIEVLKQKGEEYAITAELKGFRVEKIIINSCL